MMGMFRNIPHEGGLVAMQETLDAWQDKTF